MNKVKHLISMVITMAVTNLREWGNLWYNFTHSPQLVWYIFYCRYFSHNNKISVKLGANRFCECKLVMGAYGNHLIIGNGCNWRGVKMNIQSGSTIKICKSTINGTWEHRITIGAMDGCRVEIGEGSLLSDNIYIHTTDYHPIYDESGQRCNQPDDIIIGNNVWIGKDVMLLKGTHIADGCIIGARSVLNKHYDMPNSIIAGIPAQVQRTGVSWQHN